MWRFALAQATGSSHERLGEPCQDRIACRVLGETNDTLLAVAADGAGSAPRGGVGAEVALGVMLDHVMWAVESGSEDPVGVLRAAGIGARDAVLRRAADDGQPVRSYATTLVAALVMAGVGAGLQIGDGLLAAAQEDAGWAWVFWPQHGEFANATYFLTDDGADERLQVEALPGSPTDIALLTDGLEPLALHYASRSVHAPFFRGLLAPLHAARPDNGSAEVASLSASLGRFLASDRVRARTDDDLSLALATRRPVGSEAPNGGQPAEEPPAVEAEPLAPEPAPSLDAEPGTRGVPAP